MSSIDKGKSVPATLVHIHLLIASSVQSKLNDRVFRRAAAAAYTAATPLSCGACAATKSCMPPPPLARASASRPRPAAPLLLQQQLTLPRPEAARRRHRGWTGGVSNRQVQQPPAASLRWPRDPSPPPELQLRAERPRWRPARRRGTARALSPPRGRRKAERMKAAFPRAAIGTEDTAAPLACASWGSVSFSFRDLSIVNISRSSR